MGFDDIYLARYGAPPLTTVRFSAYGMGVAATEMAIAAVEVSLVLPVGRELPVELCLPGLDWRGGLTWEERGSGRRSGGHCGEIVAWATALARDQIS